MLPTHDITLGDYVGSTVFADDGRLYIDVTYRTLNVWAYLVYLWPEILAGMTGLALLLLALRAFFIWRRPRRAGRTYCRRCNYEIAGLSAGARCPECGVDLAKRCPVAGHGVLRRLAPSVLLMPLLCGPYLTLQLAGVSRTNSAQMLFHWHWRAPVRWGVPNPRRDFLADRGIFAYEIAILEIDPRSGATTRQACTFGFTEDLSPSIGPGGRFAVGVLANQRLAAIDLRTGRRSRTLGPPLREGTSELSKDGPRWRHIAGWLDDTTVCVQFLHPQHRTHRLYRWNVVSGALDQLADIPAPLANADRGPAERLLFLAPATSLRSTVEIPDEYREGAGIYRATTIRIRNLADATITPVEISENFDVTWPFQGGFVPPILHSDFFVLSGRSFSGKPLTFWYTPQGRAIHTISAPGEVRGLGYHEPTRRLFVATSSPCAIHVLDLDRMAWTARLAFGTDSNNGYADGRIAISPDARFLALSLRPRLQLGGSGDFYNRPESWNYDRHLLIYDLAALQSGSRDAAREPPVPAVSPRDGED